MGLCGGDRDGIPGVIVEPLQKLLTYMVVTGRTQQAQGFTALWGGGWFHPCLNATGGF